MKENTNIIIEELKTRIVNNFQPEKIVLFGSYAYGIPKKDSDIDLLIIKKSNLPKYRRMSEVLHILHDIEVVVEPIVYTPEEVEEWKNVPHAFITSIMKNGKVIYEKSK